MQIYSFVRENYFVQRSQGYLLKSSSAGKEYVIVTKPFCYKDNRENVTHFDLRRGSWLKFNIVMLNDCFAII